ncbi:unnamed protein product [Ectocarpus fasciculatus]
MSKLPNILITGTPGTGKTSMAEALAERTGLRFVNTTKLIKDEECHEGTDAEFDTLILDEDKFCDVLEPIMEEGGVIIDYHSCELFPERWFQLVLVLTADTQVLYDRLAQRGYTDKKVQENMECEIMQIVQESAMESYDRDIVQILPSNTIDDLESNVERASAWLDAFKLNNL